MNTSSTNSDSNSTSVSQRLVTLDFLRGVAIFGMTLFHILFKMYDIEGFLAIQDEILEVFPLPLLIFMGLFAYLGSWYGFFLLISSIVNAYAFTSKTQIGLNPSKLLLKQTITGFGLIFFSYVIEGFFGYHGDLGYTIRNLEWTNFTYFQIEALWIQTLQIIGFCLIFNGLIMFLMFRKRGYEKTLRNIVVYIILIILVLVFTPFISNWISNSNWSFTSEDLTWPDISFVYQNRSFKTWVLTIINGPKQPLFPYLASSFVGSLIGIVLANPQPSKKILLWLLKNRSEPG